MNLRERIRQCLVQRPNCLGVWEGDHCVMKQGINENTWFILSYTVFNSFLSATPLLHQPSNCSLIFSELYCKVKTPFVSELLLNPRLSFMSWCINKVFLPTQAQSLFKFSLVSLVHFPYSHAIWQKDAFSPFYIFLQLDPLCFSCVRFSNFVLYICPRYFHLLQKRLARVFELSTWSL